MNEQKRFEKESEGHPEIALITNHGYAGVKIPVGGAPDTGGQNFYVNQLAEALSDLGYAVTIFARGGFPFFESERIRRGQEMLSSRVRYVYVPGGGDSFIRKEEIAVALDEQSDWLMDFVAGEASRKGCKPWQVYQFVNTHYWDAAVLGVRIVEKWMDDVAASTIIEALDGVVDRKRLEHFQSRRHGLSVGLDPAFHAGDLLVGDVPAARPATQWAPQALKRWLEARRASPDEHVDPSGLEERIHGKARDVSPILLGVYGRRWIGEAVLGAYEEPPSLAGRLRKVDTHVWTPHSIGELKDLNYSNKPLEVRRDLKFCERRSHERMVCDRTHVFASTSTEITEHLVSRLGVSPENIFYFPPCVDRSLFRRYGPEEREATYQYLSRKSGIEAGTLKNSKIVFETSRQDSTKRKDLLLGAFAQAARQVQDAYLFIGGGPENDVFRELEGLRASDPVLAERAFLLGFIPDEVMYPLFDLADLFVTPSEMEGFGMSASQAAATGTALITSDLVPFSVLYAPEDAVIVRAGDQEGFADAIKRVLSDPEERTRRGEALGRATKALDWEEQTRKFIDHIRHRGIDVRHAQEEES